MIDKKLFGRALGKAWKNWANGTGAQNFDSLCQFFSFFLKASEGRGQEYRNSIHRFLHQELCLDSNHLKAFWAYVDQDSSGELGFSTVMLGLDKTEQFKSLLPFIHYLCSFTQLSVGEEVLLVEFSHSELQLSELTQKRVLEIRGRCNEAYRILEVKDDVSDEALKRSYRQSCRLCHPDVSSRHHAIGFYRLQEAYAEVMEWRSWQNKLI